jgi:hypothetical protein
MREICFIWMCEGFAILIFYCQPSLVQRKRSFNANPWLLPALDLKISFSPPMLIEGGLLHLSLLFGWGVNKLKRLTKG